MIFCVMLLLHFNKLTVFRIVVVFTSRFCRWTCFPANAALAGGCRFRWQLGYHVRKLTKKLLHLFEVVFPFSNKELKHLLGDGKRFLNKFWRYERDWSAVSAPRFPRCSQKIPIWRLIFTFPCRGPRPLVLFLLLHFV